MKKILNCPRHPDLWWAAFWEVSGVAATVWAASGAFERLLTFVSFHALATSHWAAFQAARKPK